MATFNFSMSKKDAIISVKKALNGKMAILSDKNDCLTELGHLQAEAAAKR